MRARHKFPYPMLLVVCIGAVLAALATAAPPAPTSADPDKPNLHRVVTKYELVRVRHSFPGSTRLRIAPEQEHRINFDARNRSFALTLVPHIKFFHPEISYEFHDHDGMHRTEFDQSRFLVGQVDGELDSDVDILIREDLSIEGTILLNGDHIVLEPAHRYFDNHDGLTVVYVYSDLHINASEYAHFCGHGNLSPQSSNIDSVLTPPGLKMACGLFSLFFSFMSLP